MQHNNGSAPVPPAHRRRSANALIAALATVFAGLGLVAASTAMSAGPVRSSGTPPSQPQQIDAPAPRAVGLTSSVVLLVSSAEQAERLDANRASGLVVGARGQFDVQVAVVRTDQEELLLRSMLFSDAICPVGDCGNLVIIDLRGVDAANTQRQRGLSSP